MTTRRILTQFPKPELTARQIIQLHTQWAFRFEGTDRRTLVPRYSHTPKTQVLCEYAHEFWEVFSQCRPGKRLGVKGVNPYPRLSVVVRKGQPPRFYLTMWTGVNYWCVKLPDAEYLNKPNVQVYIDTLNACWVKDHTTSSKR